MPSPAPKKPIMPAAVGIPPAAIQQAKVMVESQKAKNSPKFARLVVGASYELTRKSDGVKMTLQLVDVKLGYHAFSDGTSKYMGKLTGGSVTFLDDGSEWAIPRMPFVKSNKTMSKVGPEGKFTQATLDAIAKEVGEGRHTGGITVNGTKYIVNAMKSRHKA